VKMGEYTFGRARMVLLVYTEGAGERSGCAIKVCHWAHRASLGAFLTIKEYFKDFPAVSWRL
jgi:hypothetical protein